MIVPLNGYAFSMRAVCFGSTWEILLREVVALVATTTAMERSKENQNGVKATQVERPCSG
jgi:hypothetical protein